MCLIVKKKEEFRVAKRAITVYKVLYHENNGGYHTPFQGMKVPSVRKGEELKPNESVSRETLTPKYDRVDNGVIHLYTRLCDAAKEAWFKNYCGEVTRYHVFKMVIPKGERYIADYDNRQKGAMSVRFVKRLTHDETGRIYDGSQHWAGVKKGKL